MDRSLGDQFLTEDAYESACEIGGTLSNVDSPHFPMPPRRLRRFASLRLALITGLAFLVGHARGSVPEEQRFSATLSTSQRAEIGLGQLTEDNVAVIDALVRQDEESLKKHGRLGNLGSFSQRRSDHERDIAGFSHLTAEQLARLDGLAAMRISPPPPLIYAETAGRRYPSDGMLLRTESKPYLEVHGSTTLSYSWSKAGSVRGAEMNINLQDPAHRFSINIGYSEYHGKGLAPIYDPADDLYRYRSTADSPLDRR
jgi:hypothetical protein